MQIPSDEIKKRYKHQVERGNLGKNIGLSLDPKQFGRLTKYMANIQQGRVDLIAGSTGSGKSSFILDSYMVNPIQYVIDNPGLDITLRILYFNMELPVQNILAKYVARRIFELTKGQTILSVNKVFQKGEVISEWDRKMIQEYSKESDFLLDYCRFYEGSITGKYMYKEIMNNLKELGVFTDHKDPQGNVVYTSYQYNNPDTYIICIADHLGLLSANAGERTKKDSIDATINNCVIPTRNRYGVTWALCQQMNRANEDPNRMKSAAGSAPLLGDLKDSAVPGEAADTVIAFYKPQLYGLPRYMGYDLEKMKKFFICAKFLKNRDGESDIVDPFGFLGKIGLFKELPYAEDFGKNGNPTESQIISYFNK